MLSQMECGIDEWGTGIKTEVPFTTMDYHPMFDAHLKCLCELQEATKKHELLDKICFKLYNVGWYVFTSCFCAQLITSCLSPASIPALNPLLPPLVVLSLPVPL